MKVTAIIHSAEAGGNWAEVPTLPGYFTEGDTTSELTANL
jgi:predicted RNase H-like HicB family nuclease